MCRYRKITHASKSYQIDERMTVRVMTISDEDDDPSCLDQQAFCNRMITRKKIQGGNDPLTCLHSSLLKFGK